ncbi:hypothetical protein LRS74_06610 [Streptomyces sp. LX-29]|uniref:hypothetical protein n=1 Tax=Streptomyces sp. LX-29 TaxID=2900152 RepID=UPI00240E0D0F|nr:hypothetical protein [Streptomyces sp. LX-29]WFB06752.1 hypothetical protein LRS74_06610 [Streptomyces sp. LX-29]
MIDIVLPTLDQRELTMVSEDMTRGPGDPQRNRPEPLAGRIVLGGPLSVPVTTEFVSEDPELKAFVASEAGAAVYHLLHLSLTCATQAPPGGSGATPRSLPDLHTVNVDLTLSAEAGAAFPPVAWSMTPQQVTETVQATTNLQLGPQLAFVGHSRTTQRGRVCVEALRELRSDPGWEIRHTRTVPIAGGYRLAMVVRAPARVVTRVAVGVGASVRRGHLLRRYREEIPDPLRLSVEL